MAKFPMTPEHPRPSPWPAGKDFRILRRIIASLQVIGGVAGLALAFARGFAVNAGAMEVSVSVPLFATIPFAAAIVTGVMLWLDQRGAVMLSLALWLPQLVTFDVSGVQYRFTTGLAFYIGKVGAAQLGITFSAGGKFVLFFPDRSASTVLLNLVAVAVLVCLIFVLQERRVVMQGSSSAG